MISAVDQDMVNVSEVAEHIETGRKESFGREWRLFEFLRINNMSDKLEPYLNLRFIRLFFGQNLTKHINRAFER